MNGIHPPAGISGLLTSTVTPGAVYEKDLDELAAYPASPSTNYRGTLVVNLPGSSETAGRGPWVYTAQNLGFDVIGVNYDNKYEQGSICSQSTYITTATEAAACFTNVSQAKLDFTGPCIPVSDGGSPDNIKCGTVPDGSGNPYTVGVPQDDIYVRIGTLLQYLCTNYDTTYTKWENYLAAGTTCSSANPVPNWSKIILGGHSQGGGMATFAADHYPIIRALNLSAPAQATAVGTSMIAASYFSDFAGGISSTAVRDVYGLVSQNDTGYYDAPSGVNEGVFESVWQAIGFNTPANHDAERKLNVAGSLLALDCSTAPSHNFSTDAAVSPGGGHNDPSYIWNEDVFEYMLID